jgi:hypothetical protein
MAPPHVSSFQKFEAKIPNRLEASIAFGLFMESEKQWAAGQGSPSDARYSKNQETFLTDHEIERYAKQAREHLADFGNKAIASKRAEFLQEAFERHETAAARGHSAFRWFGVAEAAVGAFAWTLFLIILVAVVARFAPIDVVDILHKVEGR